MSRSIWRGAGPRVSVGLTALVVGAVACSSSPETTPAASRASSRPAVRAASSATSSDTAPTPVGAPQESTGSDATTEPGTPTSPPGTADAGRPDTLQPPSAAVAGNAAAAPGTLTVRTKAVELTVLGVERVREIGGRQSRPGYEFVIVDTSWTNVIPLTPVNKKEQSAGPTAGFGGFGTSKRTSTDPADIEMKPTPYVVPMLAKQMWLFTDGRFADTVDLDAEEAVADRFPKDGFGIAKLDDVVRGKVVFEAPINPKYQAFQFYDTNHGHALIPLTGSEPPRPAAIGPAAENAIVQLAVSEARFLASDDNVVGLRPYMVGVRGVSRSPKDVAVVPARFVFAQTDQGCIASPEPAPEGLSRPFGTEASFPPTGANEAQLVFRVPSRTRAVRVLIRAQNGGPIDLPAGAPFQPAWPTPVRTITDGTVARVHVLPTPGPPVNLPPLNPGRAYQLVDLAVENLHPQSGIELQYAQLRLQASDGTFIDPSPLSSTVPCALPDGGVIPPAATRRFVLVYDIPADAPARRLNYRGFQLEDTTVDVP